MSGRTPVFKSQRVRPHVPTKGDWITLPGEPYKGPRPDLRQLELEGPVSAGSKKAWELWWSSPMAHQWTEAEWPMVLRMLAFTEMVSRQMKRSQMAGLSSLMAELRQLEDRLGISEKGRRDLRWLLPNPSGAESPATSRRRASSADMRSRLKVVGGSG